MKEITLWQTMDGVTHTSPEQAEAHEKRLMATENLRDLIEDLDFNIKTRNAIKTGLDFLIKNGHKTLIEYINATAEKLD